MANEQTGGFKVDAPRDGYCDVEEVGESIRISIGTEPKSVRASITIDRAGARALGAALLAATDAGEPDEDGEGYDDEAEKLEADQERRAHHAGNGSDESEPDDEHGLADLHDEGDAIPDTVEGRML